MLLVWGRRLGRWRPLSQLLFVVKRLTGVVPSRLVHRTYAQTYVVAVVGRFHALLAPFQKVIFVSRGDRSYLLL